MRVKNHTSAWKNTFLRLLVLNHKAAWIWRACLVAGVGWSESFKCFICRDKNDDSVYYGTSGRTDRSGEKLNDVRNCFANLGRGRETRRQQGTSLLCKLCNLRLSVNFREECCSFRNELNFYVSEAAQRISRASLSEIENYGRKKLKWLYIRSQLIMNENWNYLCMEVELSVWHERDAAPKGAKKTRLIIKLLNWNKLWLFGKTSKDINPVARSDSYIVCREKLFPSFASPPKAENSVKNWKLK